MSTYKPVPALTAELHTTLRNQIADLSTLEACRDYYDNTVSFQDCLQVLRSAQTGQDCEVWSKEWAEALSRNEPWAWDLNLCRKTVLTLVYRICNIAAPGDSAEEEAKQMKLLEDIIQKRRMDELLLLSVHMDRANCLFNMTITETGERGLGWYAKGEEESYKNLRDPPLPLNPSGGTINKRLRRLQKGLYADNEALNRWLAIAAPERLQ